MEQLNDKWYRIIGLPLIALVSNIIFYYDMNERHGFSFWTDYLYTLFTAMLLWEVNRLVIIYTRRRFATYRESGERILWTAVGIIVITVFIVTLISIFYDVTDWWGYEYTLKNYLYNNFAALTYCVIIGGIYEGTYYFRKWKHVEIKAEMLKKENLQSQLESLKQQVNPHFLFNSLNTLSFLMRKDVDRAELFLDELSKVYRYLLQNNEDGLIALEKELQFIQSYIHLLSTRYGSAIQVVLNVDPTYLSYGIPSLTLQLLIENAVKHNIIDKDTPLVIEILTNERAQLMVRNNVQRKILKLPSNKIGLTNIAAKYKLLDQPDIEIIETADTFLVQIPLIKNGVYETADC
jgi:sensor histidine kinase YesM